MGLAEMPGPFGAESTAGGGAPSGKRMSRLAREGRFMPQPQVQTAASDTKRKRGGGDSLSNLPSFFYCVSLNVRHVDDFFFFPTVQDVVSNFAGGAIASRVFVFAPAQQSRRYVESKQINTDGLKRAEQKLVFPPRHTKDATPKAFLPSSTHTHVLNPAAAAAVWNIHRW